MRPAHNLLAAYQAETEQLTAERFAEAVLIYLVCTAGFGIFQYVLYPSAVGTFLALYGLSALAVMPGIVLRRGLLRRRLMVKTGVVTGLILSLLPHVQTLWVAPPTELVGIATVVLVTAMSLFMPWGARAQALVAITNVAGYAFSLTLAGATSTPPVFLLFAVSVGAILSVWGAHSLELHRFAIFREATRSEEEAAISHMLVAIAKEINAILDPHHVLDRIAGSTRAALGCDWSLILLWDEQRGVFRLAGGAGHDAETFRELSAFEFSAATFPLISRILEDGHVEIASRTATDSITAGFMQRWRTHCLLATALTRSGAVVGLLMAGGCHARGSFSERARQLFRGIAQHAAIALNNVRLVAHLRQADRLKSEFVAAMSHELRTPLNVILGYTDLLSEDTFGPLNGDQRQVLGRVHDSAGSLLELINETLDVNRLEAGRAQVQLKEVSLATMAEEMQREADRLPPTPGVTLRWEFGALNGRVRTDPIKFKIIAKNLIGNALKFTESGHVSVGLAHDALAGRVTLLVRDTGCGIAPDDLPHIFDMFRQVANGHEHGGVGLGLYILKRFVEQLEGDVTVSSVPSKGTTFTVSVPVAAVEQASTAGSPQQRAA